MGGRYAVCQVTLKSLITSFSRGIVQCEKASDRSVVIGGEHESRGLSAYERELRKRNGVILENFQDIQFTRHSPRERVPCKVAFQSGLKRYVAY